jgi:phosphatidylcholine synthase
METFPRLRKLRAWSVHFYTSLGLIFGLCALNAIAVKDAKLAFIYLGIALFIDATDGTLARAWNVKIWTPHFDGRKLDDITDYLNYAFIPAFLAYRFELVTGLGGMVVLCFMLLAAVYGFCQSEAKTNDGFFTGWPNFWNILIFYLFAYKMSPEINGIIIAICAALIFVPIKYVSFSTRQFRRITRVMALAYGIILGLIVSSLQEPNHALLLLSLFFPVYYTFISLMLNLKSEWQAANGPETIETESH